MPQAGTAFVPVLPETSRITPDVRRVFSKLGPYSVQLDATLRGNREIRAALAALPHVVVPVDVDDREIMALRAQLQALQSRTVGIDISAGQARAELDAITGRLQALSGRTARLDVSVDAGAATAALEGAGRAVAGLDGRTAGVRVAADTADAITGIGAVGREAGLLDGLTSRVRIEVNAGDALRGISAVTLALTGLDERVSVNVVPKLAMLSRNVLDAGASAGRASLSFAGNAVAVGAAVNAFGSLYPVVQAAGGALAILPAAGLAGAAAMGTFKIGLFGIADAVKVAFDPTKAEQFQEALAKLSPEARATVLELQGMGPALTALRLGVQDQLLRGMADTLSQLAGSYLPMARGGFETMAGSANRVTREFAGWLTLPGVVDAMRVTTGNVTLGFDALLGAVVPAGQAIAILAAVGSEQLLPMGNVVTNLAVRFRDFIAAAAESGELSAFLEHALTQLGLIFQILGNVGIIFLQVFQAGAASGANMLSTLVGITGALAAWASSAQGVAVLGAMFDAVRLAMSLATPLLVAFGTALTQSILPALAGSLPALGAALGALAPAMAPLGVVIAALLPVVAQLALIFATVLTAALQALTPILVALTPLLVYLAQTLGLQLVAAINVLAGPLLSLATFMGQHPALVQGVITVLSYLAIAFQVAASLVGAFLGPLLFARIAMTAFGLSASAVLAPFTAAGGALGAFTARVAGTLSVTSLAGTGLQLLGVAVSALLRTILGALGPIGALILIFVTLYTTQESFRVAVGGLLAVFANIVGLVVGALLPVFALLSQVMTTAGGVFAGVAAGLATALVPVLNLLADVLTFLTPVIVPLVEVFLAVRAAMLLWAAAQWALNIAMSANPIGIVVIAIAALIGAVVYAYQNFEGFRSVVDAAWAGIRTATQVAWSFIQPIFAAIGTFITSVIGPAFMWLYQNIIQPYWSAIGAILSFVWTSIIQPIFSALGTAITAVGGFFVFLWQNVVVPAWNAIGAAISVAWSIIAPILEGIGTALRVVAAIVATVLLAPFLIAWNLISAAVRFAWENVLRPIWEGAIVPALRVIGDAVRFLWEQVFVPAWQGISAAVSLAWALIGPIWDALVGVVRNVIGVAIMWLWTNIFQPAWAGIQAVVALAWDGLRIIWDALVFVVERIIGPAIMFLWNNVFVPAWNGIAALLSFVWNNIIQPLWTALVFVVERIIGPAIMFLWNNVFVPAWNGIAAVITFVWNNIIRPLFDALVFVIERIIGPAVMFLWNNVIVPAWNGIGAVITFVWERIIRPAFDAVVGGLNYLGDNFMRVVRWIGDIWNGLKAILARPINFLINTVWNNGIRPAWNAVAKLVGIGEVGPLQPIAEFAEGGTSEDHRAHITPKHGPIRVWSEPETGGEAYIPMSGAKRDAAMPVLSTVADRFGYGLIPHADARERVRFYAAGGIDLGALPSSAVSTFADSGLWRRLGGVAQGLVPGTRITSSYRPGSVTAGSGSTSYHASGRAVDLGGNMPAINRAIAQRFPNSSELIYTPGINLYRGRPHRYGAVTAADHFDHVHWAMENEAMLNGAPGNYAGGAGGGGGFSFNPLPGLIRAAFTLTDPIIAAIRAFTGSPPPEWKAVPPALATTMRDKLRDFLVGKAEAMGGSTDGGGAAAGPTTAGQVAHAREIGIAAKERGLGKDAHIIGLMTGLQESGIRILANRAVPASFGFPHEGVGGDHDSVGIFQQRQAGWGTLAQRMNARASAGLFYNRLGRGPYGDFGRAAQRVQVSAFPGAYSKWQGKATALSDQTFDRGGMAYGRGLMLKEVMAPERVLPPRETQAYPTLTRLSQQLEAGRVPVASKETAAARRAATTGAGSETPLIGTVVQQLPDGVSARKMVQELSFELRRRRTTGVHGR